MALGIAPFFIHLFFRVIKNLNVIHGYTWIQLETDTTLRIESRYDRPTFFFKGANPVGNPNLWSAISAGGCEGSKISNVAMISIYSRLTTYMTKQRGYNNSSGSGVWPTHIYIYIWQPIYVVNTGRLHGFDFEIYMKQLLLYIYVHTNSYAIFYQFVLCVLQENPRSKCSHMAEWI